MPGRVRGVPVALYRPPSRRVTAWGSRLREVRRELHMTQRDLAARLGVAPNTVSSWETGRFEPLAWERVRFEAVLVAQSGASHATSFPSAATATRA